MQSTIKNRTIFQGDNIDVLRGFNDDSIDLMYLDPPFNKKQEFIAPIGSNAEGAAFQDYWKEKDIKESWLLLIQEKHPELYTFLDLSGKIGDKSNKYYLIYMAIRLLELHRILKPTGSLYFHCDQTMSHSIKLLLDCIFGHQNFKTEITWRRTSTKSDATRNYPIITDSIFFYVKSQDYYFQRTHMPYSPEELKKAFPHQDPDGRRWASKDLRSPTYGATLVYDYHASNGKVYAPHRNGWATTLEKMKARDAQGLLHFPKKEGGRLRYKLYADESKGKLVQNLWDDFTAISSHAKERTGYPTQKPLALLKRIIQVSCPPGGIVLDPFCGCATACVATELLNWSRPSGEEARKWVGIDISQRAYQLVIERLTTENEKLHALPFKEPITYRSDSDPDYGIPQRTDKDYQKLQGKYKKEIKELLYGKQSGDCEGCKQHFHCIHLEIDHKVPKAKGGSDSKDNLMLLCSYCNRVKGTKPLEYLHTRLKDLRGIEQPRNKTLESTTPA